MNDPPVTYCKQHRFMSHLRDCPYCEELRAAAARLRSHYEGPAVEQRVHPKAYRDTLLLRDAYLAEHPADDDERRTCELTPAGNPAPEYVLEFVQRAIGELNPQWLLLKRDLEDGVDVAEQVQELADRYGELQHQYWKGLIAPDGRKLQVKTVSPPIGLG